MPLKLTDREREMLGAARATVLDAEFDSEIASAKQAHRDAITRSAVADALRGIVNEQALKHATNVMLATSTISLRPDGAITEITLENGTAYASIEVAAETWLERLPWLHRDWDVAEQRIVSRPVGEREISEDLATDAAHDFEQGYRSAPVAPMSTSKATVLAEPSDASTSNADEDFEYGFARPPHGSPQDAA